MNKNYLRHIKVFLGSPGDLNEERQVARRIVDDINNDWAEHTKIRIELVGWEFTLPAAGRPQEIINTDLDQCEHFVGMIWKRWGSPPSKNGKFTSGFQEEFERSFDRYRAEGKPKITLLLKRIDDDDQVDPGEGLKRVLQFRREIQEGKEILYDTFDNLQQFEVKFRRIISRYLQAVSVEESDTPQTSTPVTPATPDHAIPDTEEPLFEGKAAKFVRSLLENPNGARETSPAQAARFRLLGVGIERYGNYTPSLGVHDANLLFSSTPSEDFALNELDSLIDCGLAEFSNENAPLWHWIASRTTPFFDPLNFKSIFGRAEVRVGAIGAMTLIRRPIEDLPSGVSRKESLEFLLHKQNDSKTKAAAINHLRELGIVEDIPILESFLDKPDYNLQAIAEAAIVGILCRLNRDKAFDKLLEYNCAVDSELADDLFANGSDIRTPHLLSAARYSDNKIRLHATRLLIKRDALPAELAQELLEDSQTAVRAETLDHLARKGETWTSDRAKRVLVKLKKVAGGTLLGGPHRSDDSGEEAFHVFEIGRLRKVNKTELFEKLTKSDSSGWNARLALYDCHFREYKEQFRTEIEDGFSNIYDQYPTIPDFKEQFLRRYTKRALSVLCKHGGAEDLALIRSILDNGLTDFSFAAVLFLAKFGEWNDCVRIARLSATGVGGAWSLSNEEKSRLNACADTIASISRDRVRDTLEIDMSPALYWRVLRAIQQKTFKELSNETLLKLLSNGEGDIRKAVALRCVQAFSARRCKTLLDGYFAREKHRFYNVVHWLDLGISLPGPESRAAAARILARM